METRKQLYFNSFIFIGILLFALLFSSCGKNSAQSSADAGEASELTEISASDEYEGGPGDDYEAMPPGFSYPYTSILDGDLSEWAGTWVNNKGERRELKPDGMFGDDVNGAFARRDNGAYSWSIGGEAYGIGVVLYPPGTDVMGYNIVHNAPGTVTYGILPTDTTKVRICLEPGDSPYLDNVYYLDESLPPDIQIGRATGEMLNRLNSSYQYNDTNNSGDRIVIRTGSMLKGFDFISVDFDYEKDSWVVESVLYSVNELQPERAVLINNTYIGDGIPIRGISYLDGNKRRYFYIGESGFDSSLSLNEFKPRFNNFQSLFEFIIQNEKIEDQTYANNSLLLENRTFSDIYYESNGNFTVFSNDINIVVYKLGETTCQISRIIINQNSGYMSMFPYTHINEYLSDRNLGEIQESSSYQIVYSYLEFNTIWYRQSFIVYLNFNMDGTLRNAEIGFPLG